MNKVEGSKPTPWQHTLVGNWLKCKNNLPLRSKSIAEKLKIILHFSVSLFQKIQTEFWTA